MRKQVKIVFGEMGAGKNYWGVRLAKRFNLEFLDGDDIAAPEMMELVSRFKPIPRRMLAAFIHCDLTAAIVANTRQSKNGIVVSQALYLNEDRKILLAYLRAMDFDVSFYWAKTTTLHNIRQLLTRQHGINWVLYYLLNKPWFQKPTHEYWTLNNNAAKLDIY